jgi:hypothetical protein
MLGTGYHAPFAAGVSARGDVTVHLPSIGALPQPVDEVAFGEVRHGVRCGRAIRA